MELAQARSCTTPSFLCIIHNSQVQLISKPDMQTDHYAFESTRSLHPDFFHLFGDLLLGKPAHSQSEFAKFVGWNYAWAFRRGSCRKKNSSIEASGKAKKRKHGKRKSLDLVLSDDICPSSPCASSRLSRTRSSNDRTFGAQMTISTQKLEG